MKEEALLKHGESVKAAHEALYDAGYTDGVEFQKAQPVGEGLYSEEQVAALKVELDEAKSKQVEVQVLLDKATSDDADDKAQIGELKGKLEAIKSILLPKVEVPAEPVTEAPVEA